MTMTRRVHERARMKIQYIPEIDTVYISLLPIPPERLTGVRIIRERANPGIYLDFDDSGRLIGIRVLDAKRNLHPETLKEAGTGIEPVTTGV